jgi:hypothetical protein
VQYPRCDWFYKSGFLSAIYESIENHKIHIYVELINTRVTPHKMLLSEHPLYIFNYSFWSITLLQLQGWKPSSVTYTCNILFYICPLHVLALRPLSEGQLMSTWKETLYILPLVGPHLQYLILSLHLYLDKITYKILMLCKLSEVAIMTTYLAG